MVSASLRAAFDLLRHPAAWLPGLVLGSIVVVSIMAQYYLGLFIAERILMVLLILVPFFMAGLLAMVRTGNHDIFPFLSAAVSGYFRVLLPCLVILFAILITITLVLIPLMALGVSGAVMVVPVITCTLSILVFSVFSDNVAIQGEKPVFESIRMSVEFVVKNIHSCVIFYLSSLVLGGIIWFATLMAWTGLLYDRLLPISTFTKEEMQNFTPDQFNALLGADGIMITAVIFFIGIMATFPLLYAFKAFFYRDYSGSSGAPPGLQGEYDNKGRWYKY